MRKLIILSIVTVIFFLAACGSKGIIVEDTDGSGTANDPFKTSIYMDETTVLNLDLPDGKSTGLSIIILQRVNDEFEELDDTTSPGIETLLYDGNKIVITPLIKGIHYFQITTTEDKKTYVEVEVMKRDINFDQQLKILAIGNSFSEDGMEYLYQIADDYGIEEIVLGILYIGGSPLSTHVDMINTGNAGYTYYKNTNGYWNYHSSYQINRGITDEDWDIITIQQASYDSGLPDTYNEDINTIINYVNEQKTNPNARTLWHMTWAYQSNSSHSGFSNYSKDQMIMYNAILDAVQTKIIPNQQIDHIIPSGTAIQNLRTSYMGDYLTRDGFHLSLDKGRLVAGLTWFHSITGFSIDNITYRPDGVTETDLEAIIEAAKNAVDSPFEVTQSTYITE